MYKISQCKYVVLLPITLNRHSITSILDVTQDSSTISIAVFCLQNLICLLFIFADQVFIDPTFSGIFVCGPLQSFVVNVCDLRYTVSFK